jgi:hypothetical protein
MNQSQQQVPVPPQQQQQQQPQQQAAFQANSDLDNLTDPIIKCKELFNQLKHSLQVDLESFLINFCPPIE